LGIDSSVIEANASLRTLVHRNTEQAYWEYVKELAAEEGVDPEDEAASVASIRIGLDVNEQRGMETRTIRKPRLGAPRTEPAR
jgi:hypothetical protein